MKKLLLVVDYQKDFVDGALGFPGAEALDGPIAEKIAAYRSGGPQAASSTLYYGLRRLEALWENGTGPG